MAGASARSIGGWLYRMNHHITDCVEELRSYAMLCKGLEAVDGTVEGKSELVSVRCSAGRRRLSDFRL